MLLDASANRALYRLRLHDVLDVVLDALCNRMGFSFVLIAVDEDTQTITTVRAASMSRPAGRPISRHALSSRIFWPTCCAPARSR